MAPAPEKKIQLSCSSSAESANAFLGESGPRKVGDPLKEKNHKHTLPETNISPENRPLAKKASDLPTMRAVSFREGSN